MISESIRNSLLLSYSEEHVDRAIKKLESKIEDGTFQNPGNQTGVINYLMQLCESYKKDPKERSEDYDKYFAENPFTELVKRNGPSWFKETLKKIDDLLPGTREHILIRARTSFWYHKIYTGPRAEISDIEAQKLNEMYQKKISGDPLTQEEKELSDKAIKRNEEIEKKALNEAAAVVYELYFKKELEKKRGVK